jgi:dihydroxy-acid dehydratase
VFNAIGAIIPCITNVQPAGTYLIDEFNDAGGVPAVIKQLGDFIDTSVKTYTGNNLGTLLKEADVKDDNLIKTVTTPVAPAPTIAIVSGNLAPKALLSK